MTLFTVTDGPGHRLEHHIFDDVGFRNSPPTDPLSRVTTVDLLPVASGFAGESIATQHELRMMDANGEFARPLVDSHSQVLKLPTREI